METCDRSELMLKMIVAMDKFRGIGKDGKLLCHLSDDLKYFKSVTDGQIIIMGRKTWDSLPVKPLPNRKNVVLTKDKEFKINNEDIITNIDFDLITFVGKNFPEKDMFIIGGQSIYEQFMPYADMLYVTHIHDSFEADTFFPVINMLEWQLMSYESGMKTKKEDPDFSYAIYRRIRQ